MVARKGGIHYPWTMEESRIEPPTGYMSRELLEEIFYLGHWNGECPYLKGRPSRLLFLNGLATGKNYRHLMDSGYRRHGLHLYRPDCAPCQECRILRVQTERFAMSRSQKRVWKKGRELFRVETGRVEFSVEKLQLYRRYLLHQHSSDPGTDEEDYTQFFVDSFLGEETFEMRYYAAGPGDDGERLRAVGILDRIGDALSSVYFYYDPLVAPASPGVFSVLEEIRFARENGLHYYYPGYYIRESPEMNYKLRYRPCQIRRPEDNLWEEISPDR